MPTKPLEYTYLIDPWTNDRVITAGDDAPDGDNSGLSPAPVVSARVNVHSPPTGDEHQRLNLFIEIDTDWDGIDKLERAIIDKTIEWAEEWSNDQWADYSERIHYVLLPAHRSQGPQPGPHPGPTQTNPEMPPGAPLDSPGTPY